MLAPSDHVLRTLAAVPPAARVLDLSAGLRHIEPLVLLGFDGYASAAEEAVVAAVRGRLAETLGMDDAARRISRARPAALGYPDDYFEWVVAWGAFDGATSAAELKEMLSEARRVLAPGGWIVVALSEAVVGADADPHALTKLLAEAGLALAEAPVWEDAHPRRLRGIYRKVDAHTIG